MKTKTFLIILTMSLLTCINSFGQSPASLISEEDKTKLTDLISKLVQREHISDEGQYKVIYRYVMDYTGENFAEDIHKNTLIDHIAFRHEHDKGYLRKKNYLEVEAYIYDQNNKPLATVYTWTSRIPGNSYKTYLDKVIPGSYSEELMNFFTSQQVGQKDQFIFIMLVQSGWPSSCFIIWSDNQCKFYDGTKDGYKEISKSEFINRYLDSPPLRHLKNS